MKVTLDGYQDLERAAAELAAQGWAFASTPGLARDAVAAVVNVLTESTQTGRNLNHEAVLLQNLCLGIREAARMDGILD